MPSLAYAAEVRESNYTTVEDLVPAESVLPAIPRTALCNNPFTGSRAHLDGAVTE